MREVLYRKYRPKRFEDVLGQDHVVGVLKSAVKNGNVAHAYIFSGPHGTGKTSVARILAREVGCHEYDLIEMDAASSRGIDEIRSLREGVYVSPLKGDCKVYIIDEVHMLTREAFNALLKTLEEPPAHALFILATTEPDKVPETIISRCQHLSFKKIPENILRSAIQEITRKEGFEVDEDAADLIAFFSDGSLRDAQTMLDQLISLGDRRIEESKVRQFLLAPKKELIFNFISCLIESDFDSALRIIQDIGRQGADMHLFLKFVLRYFRFLLLFKLAPKTKEKFSRVLLVSDLEFLRSCKDKISVKEAGFILTTLLETYDRSNRAYLPQLPLELALARLFLRHKHGEEV
jgi:DNA polymerase-3 subunit gamma/tau